MKKIEVKIKEKDKGGKNLSLLNLRDEVVNFLYKDTVASSTKTDLQFFVLLYFITIKINDKTFLEKILDDGLPRFNKLNEAFVTKKGYLRGRQYRKMVNEHGLSEFFKNDIFFVLIDSILHIEDMQERYATFLEKHREIKKIINIISQTYTPKLRESFETFQSKRIQNERTDKHGNTHDLSMSVYRTVRMRNSRNLNLNLQKYTSVREITSKSPIDLTFLQHINPQIIFDLWEKYHVTEYMKSTWGYINNTPVVAGVTSGGLVLLVEKFTAWKRINGIKDRKGKDKARQEFVDAKKQNSQALDDLTLRLIDSVLKANERLVSEVNELKEKLRKLTNQNIALQNKVEIKKLKERIVQLENLEVSAKEIND